MADIDEGPKKKLSAVSSENGIECTSCKTIVAAESKFCSECGAKVVSQHKPGGNPERKAV